MTSPSFSNESLKKLTVAQLKHLCKEVNVVGYSKLNKDAIIAKFLGHQSTKRTEAVLSPQQPHSATENIVSGATILNEASTESVTASNSLELEPLAKHSSQLALQSTTANPGLQNHTKYAVETRTSQKEPRASEPQLSQRLDPSAEMIEAPRRKDPVPSKRAAITDLQKIKSQKKAKLGSTSKIGEPGNVFLAGTLPESEPSASDLSTILVRENHKSTTPVIFPRISRHNAPILPGQLHSPESSSTQTHLSKENIQGPLRPAEFSTNGLGPVTTHASAPNRYKRLVPINPKIIPAFSLHKPAADTSKPPSANKKKMDHIMQLTYLEFPPEETISLHAITFPPSVSQRKHVPRLSLILSGLSFEDLGACALVSRAFRYSAYLSAAHQLRRRFPGLRLHKIFSIYAPQMTNFWPYLNARYREVKHRRFVYESSFLHRALKNSCMIDDMLWTSPDNEKQIKIAVRFLLSKLFFCVSVGQPIRCENSDEAGIVVDAREIVENEIWEITYRSRRSRSTKETFYVLEQTCEVIGKAPESLERNPLISSKNYLREDWKTYISKANENSAHPIPKLIDHLQWSNHEEHIKGISKTWLARVEGESSTGAAKLAVAIRYIMACVIGNSISGTWQSATEMAQAFDGKISSRPMVSSKHLKLNLFLPFHHHVESVHFSSSDGRILHPAIAAVQTPGREYFILRDNGMQIGCEEEGIAPVWMNLLQCDVKGCEIV